MYQDWKHTEKKIVPVTKQSLKLTVRSPISQMAVITFDYQNKRQIPPGCTRDQHNANLFIDEGTGWGAKRIAQRASWRSMGYIYHRWENGMKAG